MNEDLMIEILTYLQNGFLYAGDIQRDWTTKAKFVEPQEFKSTWELLKSRRNIIAMPNQNDWARMIINPDNNILPELLRKQNERNAQTDQEGRIKKAKDWKEEHWIIAKIIESSINTIVALIVGGVAGFVVGYLLGKTNQSPPPAQQKNQQTDSLSKPLTSNLYTPSHLFLLKP